MKRAITLLTVVHRYLGLVFCLIFVIWFASGIVMVYARMPEYGAAERLARLAPLDPRSIHLTPAQALEHAQLGGAPSRIQLSTLKGRPVYRFLVQDEWVSVFGDDGALLEPISAQQALEIVGDAFARERRDMRVIKTIRDPDQWTIETPFPSTGPLHVVALGDAGATELYVASNTGEIALKTDRASRFWGYAGPVMHWFYFRPLRVRGPLWANLIVYGALVGCVLCLLGLTIGAYRYSLQRRYHHGTSATPYAGWLKWHHYAGLIFGVITFTWLFSGMLSMEPWGISEEAAPEPEQVTAIRGSGVDAARFAVTPQQALAVMQAGRSVKELDLIQFLDSPFYRMQGADGAVRLVAADRERAVRSGFSEAELLVAARGAMPGDAIQETAWLTTYDSYYYDRASERPLPVLRVKYADASGTWLYLAARDGAVLQRETAHGRPIRWLYRGLHSLDFPGLYQAGRLWDVTVVTLCAGGLLLSMTSVIVGWRLLRK